MDNMLNYQDDLLYRLTKARTNFKKTPKDRISKEYLEGRLDTVEHLWLEFLAGHKKLLRNHNSQDLKATPYMENDVYDKFEELLLDYKTDLKAKLSKYAAPSTSTDYSAKSSAGHCKCKSNVKLPKINIDSFSGKSYSDWITFRDLFVSLIHNNDSLDDVQKLLYLKGYLTDEAKQLLSNIQITQDNYSRAWELLCERYNNKKYVANQILERLLSQKNMTQESACSLKGILDTTNDCLAALSNIGVRTESWDILVIHIIAKKLDPESRRQWEFTTADGSKSDDLPSYKSFQEFLSKRYRALEFLDSRPNSAPKYQGRNNLPVNKSNSMHITEAQCTLCSGAHALVNCTAFNKKSVESRRHFAQSNNLCFLCLGANHVAINCKKNWKCRFCSRRHHYLLHMEDESDMVASKSHATQVTEPVSSSEEVKEEMTSQPLQNLDSVVSCFSKKDFSALLTTALVDTMAMNGKRFTLRAFLDQGSQSSFITEATVQLLGLKRTSTRAEVSVLGGHKIIESKAVVFIKITSKINPQDTYTVKAHVIPAITSMLPSSKLKELEWDELKNLVLADPEFHTPNRVDILLGSKVYGQVLRDGVKKGPQGWPVAQCTSLGWILSGEPEETGAVSEIKVMHVMDENNFLKRFWELEDDIPMRKEKLLIDEERLCENPFVSTTVRDKEGRYVVQLPIKVESPIVENSQKIAEKRLLGLKRKLKTGDLKRKHKDIDYQRLLWRDNPDKDINHYRMRRINNFGVASAPYLAVKALQQLSIDQGQHYPAAAKAVVSQFYMDDLPQDVKMYKKASICIGN